MIVLIYVCGLQIYVVVFFNFGCIGFEVGEGSIFVL